MKMIQSRANRALALIITFGAAVLVFAASPLFGAKPLSLGEIFSGAGGLDAHIFWGIRAPRVALAFLSGSGLALAGMAFQAIFRNALATPFTLGVSSGASFGAALALKLGLIGSVLGISATAISAFAGASLAIALVYGLTRLKKESTTATMLLAGVAISFFFSSLILFIQYLSDFTNTFLILRWLMGSLDAGGFNAVLEVAPFVAAGGAIIIYYSGELNLLAVGDDIAASRGVEVNRTRMALFFATSLMVGGIVAMCGPIGFVGMMSPHICRLIIGPDHRFLAPMTLLFGGLFLSLCDTLARIAIAPAEIPVGVITAMLGGPFFLWLLLAAPPEKTIM